MQRSNNYIIRFAAAVCVVCSIFVSGSAVSLKSMQKSNQLLDLQKNVISVSGIFDSPDAVAALSAEDIEQYFPKEAPDSGKYIKIVYLAVNDGQATVLEKQYESPEDYKKANKGKCKKLSKKDNKPQISCLPEELMVYLVYNGATLERVIYPVEGKGLWSTLKGFLALGKDEEKQDQGYKKIKGLTFYSHAETPGLGGEVDNPKWKAQWNDMPAFDEAGAIKIKVAKNRAGNEYEVDGLSGATLTANGVTYLVQFWLGDKGYGPVIPDIESISKKL